MVEERSMLTVQKEASLWRLMMSSALVMLPVLTHGTVSAFLTIALPKLQKPNPTGMVIDLYQVSWLVSLNQPSRILGLFVSAGISEKFGRKRSLILFSLAQIIVSFAVFLCNSYISLMVALIFSGFFNCMVMNPSFALLSEISVIRYRSSVASLNTLMSNLGWLIGISLGLVVPLQFYSLSLCFPSVLFLLLSWALVESPIWLLRRDDKEGARATLQWLRGENYDLELELKELETIVEQERREESERSMMGSVLDRTFLLPLLISCLAFTFNALCGVDLVGYYVGFIFPEVRLEVAAIIFQSMITLGYLSSPLLLTRLDCRHLNTIFLTLTGLGMAVMGLSLTWPSLASLSIPCLVMTGLSYGLGVGPAAYVLMSTIFTQKMKSTGVTTGQVVKAIMVTIQLKSFPYLKQIIGQGGVFFISTGVCLAGAVFSMLFIPKTKNKTISELETLFVKKSKYQAEVPDENTYENLLCKTDSK